MFRKQGLGYSGSELRVQGSGCGAVEKTLLWMIETLSSTLRTLNYGIIMVYGV